MKVRFCNLFAPHAGNLVMHYAWDSFHWYLPAKECLRLQIMAFLSCLHPDREFVLHAALHDLLGHACPHTQLGRADVAGLREGVQLSGINPDITANRLLPTVP